MAGNKDIKQSRSGTDMGKPRNETGEGQPRDETGEGQSRDETGDWRKGGNGTGEEVGGPVGMKVGVEPPGVVRVKFDRPIETMVLQPLEALMLCQVLLQNTIMCANVKPAPKSKIIVPG